MRVHYYICASVTDYVQGREKQSPAVKNEQFQDFLPKRNVWSLFRSELFARIQQI